MFKEDKMIEAIRWILNLYEPSDYDAFDEKELGSDYGLCMSEVVMALRNKAQTVYQYRIDTNYEKGLSYRGAELFNQRAILIHLKMKVSHSLMKQLLDIIRNCGFREYEFCDCSFCKYASQ